MKSFQTYKREWFGNIRGDILSGIVVALALIPESIGFSVIAGVDPMVGLYASFAIACTSAFVGGRPGMISAATAATAVLMVSLVKEHGLQYLFAATILMGILQIIAGIAKLSRLMSFVSRSVMTGFVNSLAVLIFMAQLPELVGMSYETYLMIGLALGIIYLLPRYTKAVPSPLVAIIAITLIALCYDNGLRTVGDLGALPDSFPVFLFPDIPWNFETLQIIFPYSFALAAVGLLESLLTAQMVDDLTDTQSSKAQECVGQGTSNIVSALLGGMGGCAMIGQSGINVASGGRGRLSTFVAGAFLLVLIVVLDDIVKVIPMAALVAVMIMVSIATFQWRSVIDIRRNPPSSSVVMLATVATVLLTHDLAKGVLVGVLLSGVFFAGKVSKLFKVTAIKQADGNEITYHVMGQIFFASADQLITAFDFTDDEIHKVNIDVTHAHLWDISAIAALDKAVMRYRHKGKQVTLIGLNTTSEKMLNNLSPFIKDNAEIKPA